MLYLFPPLSRTSRPRHASWLAHCLYKHAHASLQTNSPERDVGSFVPSTTWAAGPVSQKILFIAWAPDSDNYPNKCFSPPYMQMAIGYLKEDSVKSNTLKAEVSPWKKKCGPTLHKMAVGRGPLLPSFLPFSLYISSLVCQCNGRLFHRDTSSMKILCPRERKSPDPSSAIFF